MSTTSISSKIEIRNPNGSLICTIPYEGGKWKIKETINEVFEVAVPGEIFNVNIALFLEGKKTKETTFNNTTTGTIFFCSKKLDDSFKTSLLRTIQQVANQANLSLSAPIEVETSNQSNILLYTRTLGIDLE